MGVPEKIKKLEDELGKNKINKSTEHHVGLLKAKLAKLRNQQDEVRTKHTTRSTGYEVKKTADATIALIGLPNVGKSSLLNKLTNANSKVGSYQFTTLTVVPGIMKYKHTSIQILDLPGIIKGASRGKGFGKRILSVVRNADLIIFMIDIFNSNIFQLLYDELYEIGIRPNGTHPNIVIEKTQSGGTEIHSDVTLTHLSNKFVKDILRIHGINHARINIKEDINYDQLLDVILGNRKYVPYITLLNKIDLVNSKFLSTVKSQSITSFIPISTNTNKNITLLKNKIYNILNFVQIYMKPQGKQTDYEEPMIIRKGDKIVDVCNKIHRNLKTDFRYAKISGKSVKFNGQKVGLNHVLMDKDILTFVTK